MRKKNLLLALPAILLIFSVSTLPAYAHYGDHDGSSDTTSSSHEASDSDTSQSEPNHSTETKIETQKRIQEVKQEAAQKVQQLRTKAQSVVSDLRKEHKEHTAAERQKNCEDRKNGLQRKVTELVSNAQKRQDRIDTVFTKTIAYQSDNNLTVPNLNSLVSAADAAKTTSQSSVQALASLKPTIDCSSGSVAKDVASFKSAAELARHDLTTYKKATQALLTAVEAAKSSEGQQ
jgi:hypothetical protein